MPSYEFLGPYKIGDLLGRGGMGNVYSGEHVKSGQKVAVKLIADHISNEPRFRRRFDKEIRAMKMLRHPGIVQLIGYGEEDGQLFYSMELVEGETLQARIRREKRIDWKVAMDFSIQICAALKHAHDIGITHRDLKPSNLIIMPDETIKLVDFGIPKLFGDGEQTLPGTVLGTPDYMAPEQATGDGVTVRTDLYALGSVMYAMLSGRAPFKGKNATEVIESLKRDRPVSLDLVDAEMPVELVELVHQLLEKKPEDRPPTALSVMNRLKAMRVGLQQQITLLRQEQNTKVDLGDSINLIKGDETGNSGPAATSIADQPDGTSHRSIVSRGGSTKQRRAAASEATVVSGVDKTLQPGQSYDDLAEESGDVKSHFQTVDLSKASTGLFADVASDQTSPHVPWFTIIGMIAVLAIGGFFVVYATLPPSADQMYEVAMVSGDINSIKAFLRHYPDDGRYEEVFNLQMSHRLGSTLKRLNIQRKLGITPLRPIEEGFLTAMQGRKPQPAQAAARIQQWLNAFDSPDASPDPKFSDLVEMARHEQKELAKRAPEILVDPRAEKMIADIRVTMENSDSETAKKKLIGIVETFQHQTWAAPAVDEAKRQLDSLDAFFPQDE